MTSGEMLRGPHTQFRRQLWSTPRVVGAEDKFGRDTVVLDLREFVDSFDALVLASGRNDRQVRAIAEEVERSIDIALGVKPHTRRGWASADGSRSTTATSSCTSSTRRRASTTTSSTSGTPRRPSDRRHR